MAGSYNLSNDLYRQEGFEDAGKAMEAAAREIGERHGCAVLCKGGHALNDASLVAMMANSSANADDAR